jgi:hypothetical protein
MQITKELLEAELRDARSQRDQANIRLAQVQQAVTQELDNIKICNGAEKQLLALIAMCD